MGREVQKIEESRHSNPEFKRLTGVGQQAVRAYAAKCAQQAKPETKKEVRTKNGAACETLDRLWDLRNTRKGICAGPASSTAMCKTKTIRKTLLFYRLSVE